jgi:hypothetical protein
MNASKHAISSLVIAAVLGTGLVGCSHAVPVQHQAYAAVRSSRTFESDFPVVWKAVETVLGKYKVLERDPADVDALQMKKLHERSAKTDWSYGESRDKYVEYQVNGTPRRKNLMTRYRFEVIASRVMGGTDVRIKMDEEIERLKPNGDSAGWDSVDRPDTSRQGELLDRIHMAILSAPNI